MTSRSSSLVIFPTFKKSTGNCKCNHSLGAVCLGAVCIGLTLGWPMSSSISYFFSTRCNDTCYDRSWDSVASTAKIITDSGSCIGAFLPSLIADKYGRRTAFAISGLLTVAFWVILGGFRSPLDMIIVAAIGGIAMGLFVTTTAIYISEISLPQKRSKNGALAAFSAYVGVLVGSCLIFITFIRVIASIITCLAIFFLFSLYMWMVESPHFFFLQGKTLEAKLSLKNLRGATSVMEIDEEYKRMKIFFATEEQDSRKRKHSENVCLLISMSRKRRYVTLMIMLLCITQMVAAQGMEDYSKHFLNIILPRYGSLVLSSFDVLSVAICLWMVEQINKMPFLLTIGIVGSNISCLGLAIFTFTDFTFRNYEENYHLSITLTALIVSLYYFIYSLGLIPILPILTGEIFPSRYKTVALGFCLSLMYLSSMMIKFAFHFLNGEEGSNLAFLSFAIFGSFGIPIVFALLLATKSKSLVAIQAQFVDLTIIQI